MSVARFRCVLPEPFDGSREATVTVDRERGILTVRLLRRRAVETATLGALVHGLLWRAALTRAQAKAKERAARRKAVREAALARRREKDRARRAGAHR